MKPLKFKPGQLVNNTLASGRVIQCRVIEFLYHLGNSGMYRVAEARQTATDKQLIARKLTWGVEEHMLSAIETKNESGGAA